MNVLSPGDYACDSVNCTDVRIFECWSFVVAAACLLLLHASLVRVIQQTVLERGHGTPVRKLAHTSHSFTLISPVISRTSANALTSQTHRRNFNREVTEVPQASVVEFQASHVTY